MSNTVIKIENLSKLYRLGEVGTGTLSHDLNRWWKTKIRGQEDPYTKIGHVNDRTQKAEKGEHIWALKDINLDVKQGDVLGIIGKNGAGKSTLLKLLSRVTSPTTGTIKTKGRLATLLEVGTGFHPEMTGRENIYMNGTIMGMRKWEIAAKLDEIVEFAGVAKYLDTPTKRYSSGMTVRLGFAIAAFLEPEILVVDEVLAVGDAEFQKKAIGKMQDVSHGEGRTVLFVSHNMASVKSLCATGIILQNGFITYSGVADDAVSEYLRGDSANAEISLRDRIDRIGSGKLRFVDIRFKNEKNQNVSNIISGESLIIEFDYETNGFIDPSRVKLSLIIRDDLEQNVLAFSSDEMNAKFSNFNNSGRIQLHIPNLYLRGENYSIRLLAFEGSTAMSDALDIVDRASMISVLPGDLWNSGKVNRKGFSSVLPGSYTHA